MAIKSTVVCDLTGKDIPAAEFHKVTTCNVVFKRLGRIKGVHGEDIDCITDVENYEFHISAEKSMKFMAGLQKLMNTLKEE